MKIVHLSCVTPPEIGGIGRVAFQEVEGLKKRGVDASLVAPGRVPTYWSVGNAAALHYNTLQACVCDADIVHLHYPFYGTAGMVARLRSKGIIKRLVITLHMDATADGLKGFYFNLHRRIAQPRILQTADALLVSSLDYARHSSFAPICARDASALGGADRCIELPFGVDEKLFSPVSRLPSPVPRLLFVGGMDRAHAFKGIEILLRALTHLPTNVACTLVGDGDLRPSYEKLAKNLGIADRVTFRGRISDDELPDVYRGADIFVFPSTSGAEAFGLAALEAQACGVPVVASDLPGVRIIVVQGETGFRVSPGDADALAERLKYLLNHHDVRLAMGKRARERVLERFTWSKHLDGLMDVYRRLCSDDYSS